LDDSAANKTVLRIGRPEEIAYGVLFLVSDEAPSLPATR
jgi:NAD(P)-dependent dehydrogenase (short-subunit alcohol dehydrogenase family)